MQSVRRRPWLSIHFVDQIVLQREIYKVAIAFSCLMCIAHMISLPLGITYDGHVYIDLANILGSPRFPADWNIARTPLLPLTLKLSFWVFGRQPLAAIFVPSAVALIGILAIGATVKRIGGPTAGAATLVLLSLSPTLVAYQHFVLTETGTFCFLAMMIRISLWYPADQRRNWMKVSGIILILGIGYYWRQNLLSMGPLFASLHGFGSWRTRAVSAPFSSSPLERFRWRHTLMLEVAMIALIPYILALPWRPYTNDQALRDVMLKFGIIKQALASPEDPMIGDNAEAYRKAIQASLYNGHLYSGLRADLATTLSNKIFSKPIGESTPRLFLRLIEKYPGRYMDGMGRTLLLFTGAHGLQDENEIFREQILSPSFLGSKIGEGPQPIYSADKEDFVQRSKPSLILWLFRRSERFYDFLVMAGFGMTILGLVGSLLIRSIALFAICVTPIFYILPYLLTLSAVDRYAFPIHPVVLAVVVVVPAILGRRAAAWASRRPRVQGGERAETVGMRLEDRR
jgi:Dolichyl-phosphate-mannose-protein mannosyltransferase